MKICFITDSIFRYGGIERVVSVIANNLSLNHEIEILCTKDKFFINRELYNLSSNIKVNIIPTLKKTNIITYGFSGCCRKINKRIGILNNKLMIKFLEKSYFPRDFKNNFINYLNKNNYDVIIGVEGYYSILLGIIKRDLNSKVIGWQHNSYYAYFNTPNKYNWKQNELFKKYLKILDSYIVLTDEDKKQVEENFKAKVKRIYNPLSFTSNLKSDCNKKNIISVGRLVKKQKGFDLLIEAFFNIAHECRDWTLEIIGDGEEKENLENLIKKFNMENQIKIKPFTSNIESYYLNSSIFVSSSRWEGFGLVITEAMECGVPVIAFANSGPKEIINKNNENGILVEKNNVKALGNSILDLIKNEYKRKTIGKNSVIRAEDFKISIILSQWEELFNSLN